MKTYLEVPYAEKDKVKSLGAKWDVIKKKWYVEDVEDLTVFIKWLNLSKDETPFSKVQNINNESEKDFDIVIYADGASKGNPGRGGWGVYMQKGSEVIEIFGGEDNVTNNQMELMAAIKALELIDKTLSVIIKTDSKYVVEGATKWMVGWKKNNWNGSKGEVKNKELWQQLDNLNGKCKKIKFEWVKGHNGEAGNERADKLANMGCLK